MGIDQKDNSILKQFIEENSKRKNQIDKKKYKDITIDKNFATSAIQANNEYRISHTANILKLDDYLIERAFILAKEFLIKGEFDNENLLYSNCKDLGMNLKLSNKKLEPEILMEKWYEENINYNYEKPEVLECNNFTQMIWEDSTNFGIGYYHLNEKDKNINKINIEDKKKKNMNIVMLHYIIQPAIYQENIKLMYLNSPMKKR